MRTADRDADDNVAHQIHHVVGSKSARVAEEARRIAEVELAADDSCPHAAGIHAEVRSALARIVREVHADKRADITVGVRFRGGIHNRRRHYYHGKFEHSSHVPTLLVATACAVEFCGCKRCARGHASA